MSLKARIVAFLSEGAATKKVSRSIITVDGVTRDMTGEEKAAFDASFDEMGKAFDAMGKAFDQIGGAFESASKRKRSKP